MISYEGCASICDPNTDKLVGVRHAESCGFWIITHEMGTARFYAWLLSSTELSEAPVISEIGEQYVPEFDAGYLKWPHHFNNFDEHI